MAGKVSDTNGRAAGLKIDTSGRQHSPPQQPQQPSQPILSPSANRASPFSNLERHPKYYIQSGDLHLLAGNVLFTVHSYFFIRESQIFRDWLSTAASPTPGALRLGSEDASAIVLDETPENFVKFLDVFYNPTFSLYGFTIQDWTAILDQAHRWGFSKVKDLAVREMAKLDYPTVDRLALYERYEIDTEITLPLYATLARRNEPLTIEDGAILGNKATVLVCQARERLRAALAKEGMTELPTPFTKEAQLLAMLRKLFGIAKKAEEKKPNGAGGEREKSGSV